MTERSRVWFLPQPIIFLKITCPLNNFVVSSLRKIFYQRKICLGWAICQHLQAKVSILLSWQHHFIVFHCCLYLLGALSLSRFLFKSDPSIFQFLTSVYFAHYIIFLVIFLFLFYYFIIPYFFKLSSLSLSQPFLTVIPHTCSFKNDDISQFLFMSG